MSVWSLGYEDKTKTEVCNCCKRKVNKTPFTLKCNVDDFAEAGIGYSLYFKTLIFLMKYMAVQILVITLYMLLSQAPFLSVISDSLFDNYMFLSSMFFVYWLRFKLIVYCRFLESKMSPNVADFSIGVCNLPRDKGILTIEEDLRKLFGELNHYNGVDYRIHEIVFFFYTADYQRLLNEQDRRKNQLLDFNERNDFSTLGEGSFDKRTSRNEEEANFVKGIEDIESKLNSIEKEFRDIIIDGKPTSRFTGKAVVVFKTELAAYMILEKYDVESPILYRFLMWLSYVKGAFFNCSTPHALRSLVRPLLGSDVVNRNDLVVNREYERLNLYYNDKSLFILPAVNPNNIIWNHFGYSFFMKHLIRTAFFSFSLMILACSFYLIRRINKLRFEYIRENNITGFKKLVLNGLISLVILTFNNILNQFILHTIQFELHEKRTNELISQINKMVLKMFLNTTVMIFLLCFNQGPFDTNFLMYQVLIFCTITAVVSPLTGFWDFAYFFKIVRRYFISKSAIIKETEAFMFKLYENPEYNIVLNYSNFLFLFINLHFYSSFFPFWTFLLVEVHYLAGFVIQKGMFITRNSVIYQFRDQVNVAVLNIIDFAPFLVLSAQYYKAYFVFGHSIWGLFFCLKLILAVWTFAFPNEKLIDFFFTKRRLNYIELEKYKDIFKVWNYRKNNPAYASIQKSRKVV